MAERWRILTLLFLTRTAMAFQFASVGALGPLIGETFRVDAAGVGLLIGLYLLPGMVIAFPGGAVGRLFGDKRTAMAGLALMAAGGLVSGLGGSWESQLAGRTVAGLGGVLLNVVMTKMVADWFTGREIATAMGVFLNSWPLGIALALAVTPLVAGLAGAGGAMLLTGAFAAASLAALGLRYRPPPDAAGVAAASDLMRAAPRGAALTGVLVSGAIWGVYNGGLAILIGFGPILLTSRGWGLAEASSTTSLAIWCMAASIPAGGLLADRSGRPGLLIAVTLVAAAAALALLPRLEATAALMIAFGVIGGLPAGPIISLVTRVLTPATRAIGMGIFFTIYYACFVSAPMVAGVLLDATGTDGAAMDLAAATFLAGALMLPWFERLARRA